MAQAQGRTFSRLIPQQARAQGIEETESGNSPSDRSWIPIAFLAIVAFLLRMIDLGSRAMHHDESLHAVYSWYLFNGRGYTHDPMMHGPFVFHFSALLYSLFGDSEVTFRLAFVLLGSASVFMPWFLRRELGKGGAIAASLMLAFGPVFLYFSRFGHNEALLMFQTLLVIVGVFGFVRTRRSAYLYAAAVGLGLMLATKVVVYLIGFMIFSFVAMALVVERFRPGEVSILGVLRDVGWKRWLVSAGLVFGVAATLYSTFFTNLDGLCTAIFAPGIGPCAGKTGMLQYWAAQQEVARGSQPWFYYFILLPVYEVVPVVLAIAAPFLARRPRSLFFWFCAWWTVFTVAIYTYAGEKMPWLTVHLALPLVFLGALGIDPLLQRLRWPWGLSARQWSLVGLALFAGAGLIAWATIGGDGSPLAEDTGRLRRIALALVVAAIVAGAVRVAGRLTRGQVLGGLGAAVMLVLMAYSLRTGIEATYHNGDVPVELIVYVQSSPDVPFIVNEIEQLGNRTGLRQNLPLLLDGGYSETVNGQKVDHEAVSWPFEWYFRDQKAKTYYSKTFPADFSTGKYAAVLIMGTNLDPVRDQLAENYTGNKFKLNWWYPEDYKQMNKDSLGETISTLGSTIWYTLSNAEARSKVVKFLLYRELINPVPGATTTPALGGRELYFYVRNDLARGSAVTSSEPRTAAAPVRSAPGQPPAESAPVAGVTVYGRGTGGQPVLRAPKGVASDAEGRLYVADETNNNVSVFNRDGSVLRQIGRAGTGDGEFNQPWGVALGPDGSLFVADTWNHRIQKFDSQGRFQLKWGSGEIGSGPGQFYGPRDIAITPNGDVLVADTGNKRIQVFDQRGTFIRAYGTEGTNVGQFREPVGVAVDRLGRIYVADTWNQRVQVFDNNFQPLGQHPIQGWSSQTLTNKPYVAVSAAGEIYVTVPDGPQVIRVKDGLAVRLTLPAQQGLGVPTGIDVDEQGRLLVGYSQGGAAVAYELDGGGNLAPAPPAGDAGP